MAQGFLDQIIDQIQGQTKAPSAFITNLKGAIADTADVVTPVYPQEWYVLRVPGTNMPLLRSFLDGHTNERYPIAEVSTADGTIRYPSGAVPLPGFVYGFITQVDLSGPETFSLTSRIPGGQFAIYIDAGLVGQGAEYGSTTLSLGAGSYTLTVLCSGVTGQVEISLPSRIRCSRVQTSPQAPIWEENPVAQYLEPSNGSYQVQLAWKNDPNAAEWQIYRGFGQQTIAPTTVGVTSAEIVTMTFSAEVLNVDAGTEMCSDTFRVGTVLRKEETRDGSNNVTQTILYIRVDPGAPTTGADWLGRTYFASPATFTSLARVTYAGGSTIRWTDTNVRGGLVYFYRVTAMSYLQANAESDFSEITSVIVRDIVAPGNVTFNSSTGVIRETNTLTLQFTAPTDADYRATHVYKDESGTLTLLAVEPGIPGQPDAVTFVPTGAGLYRLRTIDWAGNLQSPTGGVTYTFDGNFLSINEGTTVSLNFTNGGALVINIIGPTSATVLRAAVSTTAYPDAATVDASTITASASMASLQTVATYSVGTRVYVSARAYISGVGQRLIQVEAVRDAGSGTVALGPNIEVRVTHTGSPTFQTTITYVATGTVTQSLNGAAFSAASASPIVLSRPAIGSPDDALTLRVEQAGQVTVSVVTIPARPTIDTDTVTPDLIVTGQAPSFGSTAALHQQYTVSASNPKSGGPTPTLVVNFDSALLSVEVYNGSTWNAVGNGASLAASGAVVRAVRPPFGREIQSVSFTASLGSGQGSESVSRTVVPRDPAIPPTVTARVTNSSTGSATFVRVNTTPAGGTVQLLGTTAVKTSGPDAGIPSVDGTEWTFARPGFNLGDREALFRGTVNGASDDDSVTIAEQGRDTIPVLTRMKIQENAANYVVVRCTASTVVPTDFAGTLAITEFSGITGVVNSTTTALALNQTYAITISQSDGYDLSPSFYVDFRIDRPAVGAPPGRFGVAVGGTGVSVDRDTIDIAPRIPVATGRVEIVSQTASGANWTVIYKAYTASNTPMDSGQASVKSSRTLPNGSATVVNETPSYSGGSQQYSVTVARPAGANISLSLIFGPNNGTAETVLIVPIPPWNEPVTGQSDVFSGLTFTADTSLSQFVPNFTLAFGSEGVDVVASIVRTWSGVGANVIGVEGTLDYTGVVSGAGLSVGPYTLVPFASGTTTTYNAKLALAAYIGTTVVGTAYANVPFYVDNTGT